jgi:hypothetical protein
MLRLLLILALAAPLSAQPDSLRSHARTAGVHVLAGGGVGGGITGSTDLSLVWTMGSSDRARHLAGLSVAVQYGYGGSIALFDQGAFKDYEMTNVLFGVDRSYRFVQWRASAGVGRIDARHYPDWEESEYVAATDDCRSFCWGDREGLGESEAFDAWNVPLRAEVLLTPASRLFPWSEPGPRALGVGLFAQHNANAGRSFTTLGLTLGGGLFR